MEASRAPEFRDTVRARGKCGINCEINSSIAGRLLLARIGQAVTASASKQLPCAVKHRHPASAVATAFVHRADEPGSTPTKAANRPSNRDSLFDILPFRLAVTPDAIYQDNGVLLGTHINVAGGLSAARPRWPVERLISAAD
jgi:hypothetical protein